MRIKFITPSPRAGEITHIDNITGRTLIASGFAVEEKFTSYQDRLAFEAKHAPREPLPPGALPAGTVEWSVFEPILYPDLNPPTIVRKDCNGTVHFDGPPRDTKTWGVPPAAVVAKFNALIAERNGDRPGFDKDAAIREEFAQKERESKATAGVLYGRR